MSAGWKKVQEKEVSVSGFKSKADAQSDFEKSITLYNEKYGEKKGS